MTWAIFANCTPKVRVWVATTETPRVEQQPHTHSTSSLSLQLTKPTSCVHNCVLSPPRYQMAEKPNAHSDSRKSKSVLSSSLLREADEETIFGRAAGYVFESVQQTNDEW